MADLAERYLEAHVAVNCRPSTQETFKRLVDTYILPEFGDIAATALQRSHVRALHDALGDRPYQANQVVRVLSKMFSLGMAWGMIPARRNPCRFVRMYRERRRERVLTAEEWRRLGRVLDEAEADFSVFPPAIAAIRLLLLTGCRKSEILNLRWEDIDRASGELLIRDGKTGARRVTLTPAVDLAARTDPAHPGQPLGDRGQEPRRPPEGAGYDLASPAGAGRARRCPHPRFQAFLCQQEAGAEREPAGDRQDPGPPEDGNDRALCASVVGRGKGGGGEGWR